MLSSLVTCRGKNNDSGSSLELRCSAFVWFTFFSAVMEQKVRWWGTKHSWLMWYFPFFTSNVFLCEKTTHIIEYERSVTFTSVLLVIPFLTNSKRFPIDHHSWTAQTSEMISLSVSLSLNLPPLPDNRGLISKLHKSCPAFRHSVQRCDWCLADRQHFCSLTSSRVSHLPSSKSLFNSHGVPSIMTPRPQRGATWL